MNPEKRNEDLLLLEAAAYGDEEGLRTLIGNGADVNAQHNMNGWTGLHWAAKRGHVAIVRLLLTQGADSTLPATHGELALSLAKNEEIRQMLSSGSLDELPEPQDSTPLPFTPNYMVNSPIAQKIDSEQYHSETNGLHGKGELKRTVWVKDELVLKVRTSDPPDQDFIEIEIPMKDLTYDTVLKTCCEELNVSPQKVLKLRKLPNTIVRKDKDVLRFQDFQELEIVPKLSTRIYPPVATKTLHTNIHILPEANGYVGKSNTQSTPFMQRSNYCKDGIILY